jgi:hypothetical protein
VSFQELIDPKIIARIKADIEEAESRLEDIKDEMRELRLKVIRTLWESAWVYRVARAGDTVTYMLLESNLLALGGDVIHEAADAFLGGKGQIVKGIDVEDALEVTVNDFYGNYLVQVPREAVTTDLDTPVRRRSAAERPEEG